MRYCVAMVLALVLGAPAGGVAAEPPRVEPAAKAAKDRGAAPAPGEKPAPPAKTPSPAAAKPPADASTESPQPAGAPGGDAKDRPDAKAAQDEPADYVAAPDSAVARFLQVLNEVLNCGAMGYMWRGGFFMWPILVLAIAALGVIIERWRSLMMVRADTAGLRGQVRELLEGDRVEEALRLCDQRQGPIPAVLATGLRKYLVLRRLGYDAGHIEQQVSQAIDDYGVHIVAALEKHLPLLATVASAAPMLGFLGTVQGMVIAFDDIHATLGQKNIVDAAAAGIAVALLTTVFGLVVGIPAYVAYNYFTAVINRHVLEVEESATEMIEAITLQLALGQRQPGGTAAPLDSSADAAIAGG